MSKQKIVFWIIPLNGHEFDLEDLPYWLIGNSVQIIPRGDGYALQIPSEVIGENYEPVREFAENELELINGAGRLLNPKFRPVSLSNNILGIDSYGEVTQTVVAVGILEERCKVLALKAVVGGVSQPDPREGAASTFLNAAKHSTLANDALIISGRPKLTWTDLYLLFEIVESDVGSEIFTHGWISRKKSKLFTNTANSYSILRYEGRHGKDKGNPPSNPMNINEAGNLIRSLVSSWLNHVETGSNRAKTS